jgi:hypothetical protein
MQESKTLDNQQANRDLGWLSGILDGEGSIILGVQARKDETKSYYHSIRFYNSDDEVIQKVVRILEEHEIKLYVQERQFYGGLGSKKGFTVSISNYESAIKLLELVIPDLTCKKARAELLLRFCKLRKERFNKPPNEEEMTLFNSWSLLRTRYCESSETTRLTSKDDDIVRPA